MDEKTYTMDEIMAAFAAVEASVDEVSGDGASESERFLISDVATDVRNFLIGNAVWAADLSKARYERETDDDETLFVGQNYSWFAENGEW